MIQFWVMLKKEFIEAFRDYRWVWMPAVFVLLGLTEPLTSYYMPQILENFGELPEGTIIEIPIPLAGEVIASTAGQYNLIGILVIVLAFMGILAGERKAGTAAMVLVKPVSYSSFVTAKWVHGMLLVWTSYILGMGIAWYYTFQLFELVEVSVFLTGFLYQGLWLAFIFTLTLFFSSCLPKPGIAAFGTIGATMVISFITSALPKKLAWSPSALTNYAAEIWMGKTISTQIYPTLFILAFLILMMLYFAITLFKRKELA